MSLLFTNLRLSYIITVDLGSFCFEKKINFLKDFIIFGDEPTLKYRKLSDRVYDHEFIRLSSAIPTLILNIDDISQFFENYIKDNVETKFHPFYKSFYKINIFLSFDQNGILSIRFDFYSNPEDKIKTPELIKITDETCTLVDEILFPKYMKKKLETIINFPESVILKIHETHPIISSINVDMVNKKYEKHEISGIIWKDLDYEHFDNETIKKISKNEIGLYKKDVIALSAPASLLICEGEELTLEDDYLEERINAIEIFCRQQHLLKKLDVKLDNLIDKYNVETISNLKSVIEEIRRTKVNVNSSLEFYRNTKIYGINSFIMLFDTLSEVFGLNKHYNSVQDKLKVCDELYRGLHEERRNKLTENIQWLVVILGSASLLIATLSLFTMPNWDIILGYVILILIIIIIAKFSKIKASILKFINCIKNNV